MTKLYSLTEGKDLLNQAFICSEIVKVYNRSELSEALDDLSSHLDNGYRMAIHLTETTIGLHELYTDFDSILEALNDGLVVTLLPTNDVTIEIKDKADLLNIN